MEPDASVAAPLAALAPPPPRGRSCLAAEPVLSDRGAVAAPTGAGASRGYAPAAARVVYAERHMAGEAWALARGYLTTLCRRHRLLTLGWRRGHGIGGESTGERPETPVRPLEGPVGPLGPPDPNPTHRTSEGKYLCATCPYRRPLASPIPSSGLGKHVSPPWGVLAFTRGSPLVLLCL